MAEDAGCRPVYILLQFRCGVSPQAHGFKQSPADGAILRKCGTFGVLGWGLRLIARSYIQTPLSAPGLVIYQVAALYPTPAMKLSALQPLCDR